MTQHLSGLIESFKDAPGFLTPVFSASKQANTLNIQSIGPVGEIAEFIPLGDDLPVKELPLAVARRASEGDAALFAFSFPQGEPIIGDTDDLRSLLSKAVGQLNQYPITKVNVLEFIGDWGQLPNAIKDASDFLGGHEGAQKWAKARLGRIKELQGQPNFGVASGVPGWGEINSAPHSATPEARHAFLLGAQPDLVIAADSKGYNPSGNMIANKLLSQHCNTLLLLGGVGSGKSTALLQAAYQLWSEDEERRVLIFAGKGKVDPVTAMQAVGGDALLVIDNAEQIDDLPAAMAEAERKHCKLLLAARTYEWRERYPDLMNEQGSFGVVRIDRQGRPQWKELRKFVKAAGLEAERIFDIDVLNRQFDQSNADFLATMLAAFGDHPLSARLGEMAEELRHWSDGVALISLLACTCSIEGRKTRKGFSRPPTISLIASAMDLPRPEIMALASRLPGELRLMLRGQQRNFSGTTCHSTELRTRHPIIAGALYRQLVERKLVDPVCVDTALIEAAATNSLTTDNITDAFYLTLVPQYRDAEGDRAGAKDLYRAAAEYRPKAPHFWQAWALLEEKQGNIGSV
ncbi:MAG: hypothetical protein HQL45_09365, partial [Alphaproteobacteria bacterium]|nr:hypothetical protein [Alphaproteobacteria bacterium]